MPDLPRGESTPSPVAAVVLAAGLSTRMGSSKPLLPFGEGTIIEHIVSVLEPCSLTEIIVVTGYKREAVQRCLAHGSAQMVHNRRYATGEMLSSIQVGLQAIGPTVQAVLIVLGDQPSLEQDVVRAILGAYDNGLGQIIIPSHKMRRGHPVLIAREYWQEILALEEDQSLRDFMRGEHPVYHLEVDTSSILRDMDTPDDYRRELARLERSRTVGDARSTQDIQEER